MIRIIPDEEAVLYKVPSKGRFTPEVTPSLIGGGQVVRTRYGRSESPVG